MAIFLKNLKEIVIIILIGIIIIQRSCQPKHSHVNVTKLSPAGIKIVHEYTPISLEYHVPEVGNMVDTVIIHDTAEIIVTDTPAVLREYLTTHTYYDTLYSGKQGYVAVIDTVQFNRILQRKKIIKLKPLYSYRPDKRKLYLGIGIGGNIDKFGIAGKFLYNDKKDNVYEYSYNPILRYHEVGVFFKIRIKKREPP